MKLPHVNLLAIFFILLLSFGTLTFLHDPFLHLLVAKMFGWEITSWTNNIMTGSTTAIIPDSATTLQKWLFFMVPPLTLCSLSVIIAKFNPSRIIAIPTLIIFMFNFASLVPSISGSDSANAMNVLFDGGYYIFALFLQWGIFFAMILGFAFFLYVYLENDKTDSMKRGEEIL